MPTSEVLRRLALADDFEAVRVFEAFARRVSDAVAGKRAEIASGVPQELRVIDGSEVVAELEARADQSLSPGSSVQAARQMLLLAAEDSGWAPIVAESFENWNDDRQFVEIILAVGLVGSVWMIIASTKVTFKDGKIAIEKSANTPQQLKAFADVIRAIRGADSG